MFDQRSDHPLPANFCQPNSGINFSAGKKFGKLSAVMGGNAVDLAGYRAFDYTKRIRLNTNLRYTINNRWVAGINLNGSIDSSGNYIFWQNYDSCYFPSNNTASLQSLRRVNADPYLIFYQNNTTTHTFRNRYYSNANLSDNILYRSSSSVKYSEYNYKKQTKIFKFDDGALNLGSVYIHNSVRSEVMFGNRLSNNYAVYGQLDQTSGKWNVSAGGRLEYFQIEDQKPNIFPIFRGGLSYQKNPATTFRASAGQGFRTASVAERYANTRAGAIVIFSNPDLRPERGTSLELGARQLFKWKKLQGFVDVAAFRTLYKNLMEFTPWTNPANGELGFTSKNLVADSRISGVEITAGIQQKWGKNVLSIQPGYTYMNPRNLGYFPVLGDPPENKWLKYRYRHLFRGDLNLTLGKWDVGTNIRYNSFMLRIDDIFLQQIPDVKMFRDQKPGGDLVMDVRLFRKISQHYSLGVLVKNLLNEEYLFIPGNIGQPRSFHLQLNVSI
jgi:outer membrane cobalamin receptor